MRLTFTDVQYERDVARGAAIRVSSFSAQFVEDAWEVLKTPIAPYVPGEFAARELPVLVGLLRGIAADLVVVDGYVWLDADGRPGLGARLHETLGVPVLGIAKTAFRGSEHARAVRRGGSNNPLYVTGVALERVGLTLDDAAEAVRTMHGSHRIPTLLVMVDGMARNGVRSGS